MVIIPHSRLIKGIGCQGGVARGVKKLLGFIDGELKDFDPTWVKLRFVKDVPSEVLLSSTFIGDEEARASGEAYLFTDGRRYQAGRLEDGYTRIVRYRIRDASWAVVVREERINVGDLCEYPVMEITIYGDREVMKKIEDVLKEHKCEYTILSG